MTKDGIEFKMDLTKCSRELDAAVANKVMGHSLEFYVETGLIIDRDSINCLVPYYSAHFQDAWQVVRKMRDRGFEGRLITPPGDYCYCIFVGDGVFALAIGVTELADLGIICTKADSIELAICIAALIALGVPEIVENSCTRS